MKIGIVTGVEEEAAAFCTGQHDAIDQHGPFSVRRVTVGSCAVAISCSGIGKVNATLAAGMLVACYDVGLLMVIGTAGKISAIPGDCFLIRDAVQGDYGAHRPDGFTHYTAGSWPIGPATMTAFSSWPLPDIGLATARIVTGDSFVECPDHSWRLREGLAGDLVDMETGAVAQVASRLGLPWAAIKATTDDADGGSAEAFQQNLLAAAQRAAQAAERAIAALV